MKNSLKRTLSNCMVTSVISNGSNLLKAKAMHFLTVSIIATMTLTTSCSNDDDIEKVDKFKDTEININTLVNKISSRAGYDETNLPTRFALFINQGTGYNYDNVDMQYLYGEWSATNIGNNNMLWKSSNPNASIIAYTLQNDDDLTYATTVGNGDTKINVFEDQTNSENFKKSDLLYCKMSNVNPDKNGAFNISFNHVMCKFKINLIYGDAIVNKNPSIQEAIISSSNDTDNKITTSTLFNYTTGMVNMSSENSDMGTISGYPVNSNTIEAILCPGTYQDGFKISFNINIYGDTYSYKSTLSPESFPNGLQSNTIYNINIKVGNTKVDEIVVNPKPWEEIEDPNNFYTE